MKAILEFNLPEDQNEYQMANDASNMFIALWDMSQWLRKQTKHIPDNMSDIELNTLEKCRKEFINVLINNNINLD
jgi:hypothetical protein